MGLTTAVQHIESQAGQTRVADVPHPSEEWLSPVRYDQEMRYLLTKEEELTGRGVHTHSRSLSLTSKGQKPLPGQWSKAMRGEGF